MKLDRLCFRHFHFKTATLAYSSFSGERLQKAQFVQDKNAVSVWTEENVEKKRCIFKSGLIKTLGCFLVISILSLYFPLFQ